MGMSEMNTDELYMRINPPWNNIYLSLYESHMWRGAAVDAIRTGPHIDRTALIMMMSSNGNFSALLGLCEGKPPVTGGFPSQSFGVFLWCAPEQTVEQTTEMLLIWGSIAVIMASL